MMNVEFITTEDGDDLIVSFAVSDPDLESVKSLTLLRTPKYEFALHEWERGVGVSYEDFPDDEDDLLEEIVMEPDEARVKTAHRSYTLNLGRVDDDEIARSKEVLGKMNFDKRFVMRVVGDS